MNKFKTIAIYISLLAFSLSGYAAGDADYVWLTVRNAMSGEPIEGVSITVEQAYRGNRTSGSNSYSRRHARTTHRTLPYQLRRRLLFEEGTAGSGL